MPDGHEAKIATADVQIFLLHNQHAICAAIEEMMKRGAQRMELGVLPFTRALVTTEALDSNARMISDAINTPIVFRASGT